MYSDFSEVYDKLMVNYQYDDWIDYYTSIFDKYNISNPDVLELGCGSGSMTLRLAGICREVVAVDRSDDMLAIARDKLKGARNVRLLCSDIRDFKIEKKFDVAVSACDVFNYMHTDDDLKRALKSAKSALKDGGLLIFDISSYYKLSEILGNETFVYDTEDLFYCFENEFDEAKDLAHITVNIFVETDSLYKRIIEEQTQRAFKSESVEEIIKECGFTEVNYFEPFTFEMPNKTSERIVFISKV